MRICIKINFKNYAIMCLSPKIFTTEYVFRGKCVNLLLDSGFDNEKIFNKVF